MFEAEVYNESDVGRGREVGKLYEKERKILRRCCLQIEAPAKAFSPCRDPRRLKQAYPPATYPPFTGALAMLRTPGLPAA